MSAVPLKSEFSLKEGMSDEALWTELNRVGISGETRTEIISFKKPEKYHQSLDDTPLHNVLMSNSQYAVLRKSYVYVDIFGSINESWTYYWCGINDEGKYFIRPIREFPWNNKPTLQEIADWVDRKDEDFQKRAQGDVLIKYVHKSQFTQFDIEPPQTPTTQRRGLFSFTSPVSPDSRQRQRSIMEGLIQGTPPSSQSTILTLNCSDGTTIRFERITNSPLKLGNHKLFVDGKVYVSRQWPFVCIDAESLILQHHEHKTVEEMIPKNYVAILAAQRGRDFELGNLNYLRSSFD